MSNHHVSMRPLAFPFVLVPLACSGGDKPATHPDSTGVAVTAETLDASLTPPRDTVGGARQLQWTLGDLERRLRAIGLKPIATGEVGQPFLNPTGMGYRFQGGELQAYVYGDANALAREVDRLDTVKVAPPTMMIDWLMPPSLIVSNNLAVILLTRDADLKKRVRATITEFRADGRSQR